MNCKKNLSGTTLIWDLGIAVPVPANKELIPNCSGSKKGKFRLELVSGSGQWTILVETERSESFEQKTHELLLFFFQREDLVSPSKYCSLQCQQINSYRSKTNKSSLIFFTSHFNWLVLETRSVVRRGARSLSQLIGPPSYLLAPISNGLPPPINWFVPTAILMGSKI